MLITPAVSWKRLYLKNKKNENYYWEDVLYSSKTSTSIKLIIEAVLENKADKTCNVWLPDYYCVETESVFSLPSVVIKYYPIDKKLEPDWKWIKTNRSEDDVDVFIFVHYFGEAHDVNKARVFCDTRKALLIEDCAHVLYKNGKIGQKGDFILYSPYKFLGLFDGALIKCNCKDSFEYAANCLKNKLQRPVSLNMDVNAWRIKKTIQKIFKVNRNQNYTYDEHYGEIAHVDSEPNVSCKSLEILESYSDTELREIAFLRRENLKLIDFIVSKISGDVTRVTTPNNECPLFAVYSLENVHDKENVIDCIKSCGLTVQYWPTLNKAVRGLSYSSVARSLSKELIFISVSQNIDLQALAKMATEFVKTEISVITVKKDNDSDLRSSWDYVMNNTSLADITEDWSYGEAKCVSQNWKVDRFICFKHDQPIGAVQVLKKSIFGIDVAVRINMGPIFIQGEENIDNELSFVGHIKREYYPLIPLVYAPRTFMTPEAMTKITALGYKMLNIHGFPSGYIDIPEDISNFRASLDSKWRNQLKLAEKSGLTLYAGEVDFEELFTIYKQEQEEKNFKGVDERLLRAIANQEHTPFRAYAVKKDSGDLIAFDIFYKHSNSATYYVGWNNDEGRKYCLNNYLLYYGALELSKEGVTRLDLGGIDAINTESIAKFKMGMSPNVYRHMGEFIKF